jgi:hypothetical protein
MISSSIKAKILVLSVFFVGVITGIFLLNFYETRVLSGVLEAGTDAGQTNTEQPAVKDAERSLLDGRKLTVARQMKRFQDYLGLDEQQRVQIEAILEQTRDEFRLLSGQTRTQYDMIQEESRNRIRAILTDEQRVTYEELVQRQNRRGSRRRDRD